MKYFLHADADTEFAEAVAYYSNIDPALGVRFYQEIERWFLILEGQFAHAQRASAK